MNLKYVHVVNVYNHVQYVIHTLTHIYMYVCKYMCTLCMYYSIDLWLF